MSDEQYVLYRHYNEAGELLYVGVSSRVMRRTREHEKNSAWFGDTFKISIERFPNRDHLLEAEKQAIKNERPKYNIVHNRDRKIDFIKTSAVEETRSKRASITRRTVEAAKPSAKDYVIWDHGGQATVKGFGLKVTPAGTKVYIYQYRVPVPGTPARLIAPHKVTIGRHGAITPEQARIRARQLYALVARGIDPLDAKGEALPTGSKSKIDEAQGRWL